MSTITPGYNFNPTEEVTPAKLRDLVRNADISGLNWSELAGSTIGLSQGTPVSLYSGSIFTVDEYIFYGTNTTYSTAGTEFNYLIQNDNGCVALFKHNGFETNRFKCRQTIPLGQGAIPNTVSQTSVSLIAEPAQAYAATWDGNARIIGIVAHFTGTSNPSVTVSNYPRLTMRGLTGIFSLGSQSNDSIPRYLWGPVNSGTYFAASSTSLHDKIIAQSMINHPMQGTNLTDLLPSFMFGAPIWRLG